MASSSIDLSSLLQAMTGASTPGIDVNSAVSSALYALEAPQRQWQAQQQTLQTQTTALNSVENDVSSLATALSALQDPLGGLAAMAVTSSQPSLVSASATDGTAAGSHVVVVNNLATTASWYSTYAASSSATLAAGSFSIQTSTGSATVTIGSGVNTLDQVASYINQQNIGVTASVVNDAQGSRLAIVSNGSGSADDFTVTGTGLSFTQAVKGANASLTVDGIPISSASNTVTGAVNGLTLNLLGAAPQTQVNLSIAADSSQVSQAISNFVSAYNTAIGDVNTQFTYNAANKSSGPLASDSTMTMLQNDLLSAVSYQASGSGAFSTLGALGISMNDDGTLTLDSSTLNNAIQNNFSNVQNFFQGASSNGFAKLLNDQMSALTDPVSGAFTVDLNSISSTNTDLQNQINDFQTYINAQQTYLTNEYSQAEILLQELPTQEAQIQAELGNSSGSNK